MPNPNYFVNSGGYALRWYPCRYKPTVNVLLCILPKTSHHARAPSALHTRVPLKWFQHSPPDLYMSPQANTQKTNRALGPDGRGASASQRAADISLVQVLKRLPN